VQTKYVISIYTTDVKSSKPAWPQEFLVSDSELNHKDCLTTNSRSTGPQLGMHR